jgi:hypothetical protein
MNLLSWISDITSVRLTIAAMSIRAPTAPSLRIIVLYFVLLYEEDFSRSSGIFVFVRVDLLPGSQVQRPFEIGMLRKITIIH